MFTTILLLFAFIKPTPEDKCMFPTLENVLENNIRDISRELDQFKALSLNGQKCPNMLALERELESTTRELATVRACRA